MATYTSRDVTTTRVEFRVPAAEPWGAHLDEMLGEHEHRELLDALLACRASVVLSGYPSPLYDELLADWDRVEFATGTGQSARGEWSQRTEVLWSNRQINVPTLFDHSEAAS